MPTPRPERLIDDLVTATHILVNEGVMDVFGHVALRDPVDPETFWMARASAPARIGPDDVVCFGLDGEPLVQTTDALYSERFIHAAVFRNDATATASCHHHAPAIMPYCMGGRALCAVSQTGAWMGLDVPLWDSRIAFGDTPMLVNGMDQADDLARTLGELRMVLLRGHGALVTGRSAHDVVFRAIYSCREADTLTAALQIGSITPLSPGEIECAGQPSAAAIARAWSHWTARLKWVRPDPLRRQ